VDRDRWLIEYVGDSVVRLEEAGLFQHGTRALVDDAVAARARAIDGFRVVGAGESMVAAAVAVVEAEASPPPPAVTIEAAPPRRRRRGG
jgi:hypothetical protein